MKKMWLTLILVFAMVVPVYAFDMASISVDQGNGGSTYDHNRGNYAYTSGGQGNQVEAGALSFHNANANGFVTGSTNGYSDANRNSAFAAGQTSNFGVGCATGFLTGASISGSGGMETGVAVNKRNIGGGASTEANFSYKANDMGIGHSSVVGGGQASGFSLTVVHGNSVTSAAGASASSFTR
jgi:hypothetical protein